jgi:hypothetical protein
MRRFGLALVIAVGIAASVTAKGTTVKLSITGPGLKEPLVVTDAAALVYVWSNDFIGPVSGAPDSALPRYQVSFHVQPIRSSDVRVMYVVQYVVDPRTREAFVYLPGRGEQGYRLNVGTMLRDNDDGRWHRAPQAWSRPISDRLSAH